MRVSMVAGNWKMNLNRAEAAAMLAKLLPALSPAQDRQYVVAPMAPLLELVCSICADSPVKVAAQNCHDAAKGAFTGEWPASLLKELGATYVILGHSERRHVFGEGDDFVARKVKAAYGAGLVPILCIGEKLDEREAGMTDEVNRRQLDAVLSCCQGMDLSDLVVAYEPVWAIGTGKTATPAMAQEAHEAVRAHLASRLGAQVAQGIRILYGGSVKPDNVDELMAMPDIDGVLVGGASLDPAGFARLCNYR